MGVLADISKTEAAPCESSSASAELRVLDAPLGPDSFERSFSPWRITLIIVALGSVGMLCMFAMLAWLSLPILIQSVVGTIFMVVLMTPAVYLTLLRPMSRELRSRARAARLLTQIRENLEDRVRERTAELEQASQQVRQSLLILERTHRETVLITELAELLQTCGTASESREMMERFGPRLFPSESGAVYLYRASRNHLEFATGWGDPHAQLAMFPPDDCWALRRGRAHSMDGGHDLYCEHFSKTEPRVSTLCIPMMAQGETIGLLALWGGQGGIADATRRLATLAAEQIGLALANLQLRERLRDQAIRDPLTAMYNRRYFEETAARELRRAGESRTSVGVIMIDVDHFKRFNDTHGHEAGDAVLQKVGMTLQSHTRVEDVVCRYGGEEFVMLLPSLPADAILARAEEVRSAIHDLSVRFRGETLARISVSCGVSVYPDHGQTCSELVDAADHALYRA